MLILMLETRRGSEDGHSLKRYAKDQIYDVADTMGRAFIKSGWAKEATISDRLFDALKPCDPIQQLFNLARLEDSYRTGEVRPYNED